MCPSPPPPHPPPNTHIHTEHDNIVYKSPCTLPATFYPAWLTAVLSWLCRNPLPPGHTQSGITSLTHHALPQEKWTRTMNKTKNTIMLVRMCTHRDSYSQKLILKHKHICTYTHPHIQTHTHTHTRVHTQAHIRI